MALHGIGSKKNKIAEAIALIDQTKTAEAYARLKAEEDRMEREAETD